MAVPERSEVDPPLLTASAVAVSPPVIVTPLAVACAFVLLLCFNVPASIPVKSAPFPTNLVAVIIPEVTLLTIISLVVQSERNKDRSPPLVVILETPDILFGRITVITLFIIPL